MGWSRMGDVVQCGPVPWLCPTGSFSMHSWRLLRVHRGIKVAPSVVQADRHTQSSLKGTCGLKPAILSFVLTQHASCLVGDAAAAGDTGSSSPEAIDIEKENREIHGRAQSPVALRFGGVEAPAKKYILCVQVHPLRRSPSSASSSPIPGVANKALNTRQPSPCSIRLRSAPNAPERDLRKIIPVPVAR